jgi:hypothetical protein
VATRARVICNPVVDAFPAQSAASSSTIPHDVQRRAYGAVYLSVM